jgi:hypothetical protein
VEIKLKDNGEGETATDEYFYDKYPLFKIEIKPDISAIELKQKVLEQLQLLQPER